VYRIEGAKCWRYFVDEKRLPQWWGVDVVCIIKTTTTYNPKNQQIPTICAAFNLKIT
jgi:hypothetical protein